MSNIFFMIYYNTGICFFGLGHLGSYFLKLEDVKSLKLLGISRSNPKITDQFFFLNRAYSSDYLPHQDEELQKILLDYPWRVFSLPPSTKDYIRILESFLSLSAKSHFILISSTSVFGQDQGFISNDTQPIPSDERGSFCLQAETLALGSKLKSLTILRPAGLVDEVRHPGKILSGKQNLTRGNAPINLIHTEDVARFIFHLFRLDQVNDPPRYRTINLSCSIHESRQEFYGKYCLNRKLIPPHFCPEENDLLEKKNKIIDDSHLSLKYNFLLKYPNL